MNTVKDLQERIKKESMTPCFEGNEDIVPELVEELQHVCTHEEFDESDGVVICKVCGKYLVRISNK